MKKKMEPKNLIYNLFNKLLISIAIAFISL